MVSTSMAEKAKRRVFLQTDDLFPFPSLRVRGGPAAALGRGAVVRGVCCYCVAQSHAHGGVCAGVETESGVRDGEDGAGDIHCFSAFGDVHDACVVGWGERVEGAFDGGEGVAVGH